MQGGTVGGGSSLKWIVEQVGAAEEAAAFVVGREHFDDVSRLAAEAPAGSDGLVFLPYLAGERSPIWDPAARGVLFGLTFATTRAHMYRSVMEGVAFSLEHNLRTAATAGVRVEEMYAIGGAATSAVWTQIKADVTGTTIHVPAATTATTLGAAILAGLGVGAYASAAEAVDATVRIERTHEPDAASASRLRTGLPDLSRALRPSKGTDGESPLLPGPRRRAGRRCRSTTPNRRTP